MKDIQGRMERRKGNKHQSGVLNAVRGFMSSKSKRKSKAKRKKTEQAKLW